MSNKIILTGDRPTGRLHIGHYVGSLRNRVAIQNAGDYKKMFVFIADAQALTDNFDNPEKGRQNIIEVALDYLSVGLDPDKVTIFIQSMIPELTELTFYYMNLVTVARLQRNPTVKAEIQMRGFSQDGEEQAFGSGLPVGFFCYPISQAADITAFKATDVPVGEDQKQHVELCRNIVQRFNGIYGDVFKMPEPYIPKVGARVMSLSDPGAKMLKSDKDPNGSIYLMEKPEDILRKFKRAVTDSDTENCVRYDPTNKPGVANLMTIYSAVTGKSFDEIEQEFAGKGYGAFKPAVGEAVVETLRPIREEATRILGDKAYLESVYRAGAQKASYVAEKTLRKVYKKVGFVAR